MDAPGNLQVLHLPGQGRFEIQVEGHTAELTYAIKDGVMLFTHTGVPPVLEGRGFGSKLVQTGLEHARENGYKVRPLCSFVAWYLQRNPEYQDLLNE